MLDMKVVRAAIQFSNIRFGHKDRAEIKKHIRGTITRLMEVEKRRRGVFIRDVRNFLVTNKVKVRF